MHNNVVLFRNDKANELLKGKTIKEIVDNGNTSQIFCFTDGTIVCLFYDWFNEDGMKYQILNQ